MCLTESEAEYISNIVRSSIALIKEKQTQPVNLSGHKGVLI